MSKDFLHENIYKQKSDNLSIVSKKFNIEFITIKCARGNLFVLIWSTAEW